MTTHTRPRSPALTRALQLVSEGAGFREAARQTGMHASAVLRAWQRDQRPKCPCCGQQLPTDK